MNSQKSPVDKSVELVLNIFCGTRWFVDQSKISDTVKWGGLNSFKFHRIQFLNFIWWAIRWQCCQYADKLTVGRATECRLDIASQIRFSPSASSGNIVLTVAYRSEKQVKNAKQGCGSSVRILFHDLFVKLERLPCPIVSQYSCIVSWIILRRLSKPYWNYRCK